MSVFSFGNAKRNDHLKIGGMVLPWLEIGGFTVMSLMCQYIPYSD